MPATLSPATRTALRRSAVACARSGRPLRVWVTPCGGGARAYAVAITLIEALGRRWRETPMRVLAADSDPAAVARARAGLFSRDDLRPISAARQARFFIAEPGGLRARPLLRELCLFVRHDDAGAAPFSRLDLLVRGDAIAPVPAAARGFDGRLQESETRFQAIFSQTADAVLVCDDETGLLAEVNAAAEKLYGRSRVQLLAMSLGQLIAPPSAIRRPQAERRSEERLALPHHLRRDGSPFPVDSSRAFMTWRGRASTLWIVRDASQRLRSRSQQAGSAFIGDVVHELRAPLGVIQGFAEELRRGVRRPQDREDFLCAIERQSARVALLVDKLLELGSAQSGRRPVQRAAVPVADAVWAIVSTFAPLARRRGVKLSVDIPAGLAALADPGDLPHVFGNLLDNAIKFSRRGGRVHVRGSLEGAQALIRVEDTGPGVPPEDLEKIFDKFYRSPRTRATKGTGLGLAIVRAMVQANGGRVWARGRDAGGTSFCVALPLAPVLESGA